MTDEKDSLSARAPSYKDRLHEIQKMNPGQKQQLALKGTIQERKILIRDSNPEVRLAVLNSPKCTEAEVERIASLPSTSEKILSHICSTTRWEKSLRIKLACLKNPKLPLPICKKFLNTIGKHNVKKISKDMSISKRVRDIAQRMSS